MQKQLAVKIAQALTWRAEFASGIGLAILKRPWLANTQFIGITGSAGKTTTKDLATGILKNAGGCNSSQGSANNPLAVARTIVKTNRSDNFCVLEVSGSKQGELTWPLRMFQPDIAVITTIQREHVKGDYTLEAVAREKSRLVKALPSSGTAVLNIDDPYLQAIGEGCSCNVIWVGKSEGATLRLVSATSVWPAPLSLTIEHDGETYEAETQLHGTHLALAVMAALGVAVAAGVPLPQALPALAAIKSPEGRMQIVHGSDGVVFIRDDWKAPYWSLRAPLEFLQQATAKRKVAIIGTISDFSGRDSQKYKRLAKDIRQFVDLLIFVGPHAHRAIRAKSSPEDSLIQGFANLQEASQYLKYEIRAGDLVLIKGSAKADHLVRLILDRYNPIQCWRTDCGLNQFCSECPMLEKSSQKSVKRSLNKLFSTSNEAKANVVVGLGNPGNEYDHTPHNIGYEIVDMIAKEYKQDWLESTEGLAATVTLACGTNFTLFKPTAQINNSGQPIRDFLLLRNSNPAHCVIVYDDVNLYLGKVSLNHDGGDGGHKGLRSTIAALETDAIHRVRIGVRRTDETRKDASQRLIEAFSASDEAALTTAMQQAVSTVKNYFVDNNRANTDNDKR